mgnify:FL=1
MFLLIRQKENAGAHEKSQFTFHNVSINTTLAEIADRAETVFTFHNVSINTTDRSCWVCSLIAFTFHNVSINTCFPLTATTMRNFYLHSTMFLLIPDALCISLRNV